MTTITTAAVDLLPGDLLIYGGREYVVTTHPELFTNGGEDDPMVTFLAALDGRPTRLNAHPGAALVVTPEYARTR